MFQRHHDILGPGPFFHQSPPRHRIFPVRRLAGEGWSPKVTTPACWLRAEPEHPAEPPKTDESERSGRWCRRYARGAGRTTQSRDGYPAAPTAKGESHV